MYLLNKQRSDMEQLNYTLTNEDGTPFLREYVYHVGSFHYNWHKEIEILCVLSGRVEVCSGGMLYELEEDDLLLVNANVGHATLSRAVDSTIMLLRVNPSFLKKGCPDFERRSIRLCSDAASRNDSRFVKIRHCMAQMLISHFSDDPLDTFAFNAALNALAWILLSKFQPQLQNAAVYSDRKDEKNIHEMIQFLEERYREKLTLQDMAKRWNYSATYASQMFKEYVGINFYDYLTRIRLRQATRALSESDRKILDIASENGFQDLKSFNTKFREIFGRSPSDYRRSLEKEHIRYDSTFKKIFVALDNQRVMDKLTSYIDPATTDPSAVVSLQRPELTVDTSKRDEELKDIAEQLKKIAIRLSGES